MAGHRHWRHHPLLRKALTRPLWWWNKRRPWPIRQRIHRLPPYPVPGEARTRLITQATPEGMTDAMWMARSFLEFLDRPPAQKLGLTLYLDSSDPEATSAAGTRWRRMFPGSEVRTTWEVLEKVAAAAPELAAFGRISASGRKLAVLVDAQERGDLLFVDSDILMFRDAPELAEAIRAGGPVLYNLEAVEEQQTDPLIVARARRLGWPKPARSFNSGLLFLPRGSIPLERVVELLAPGEYNPRLWVVEQIAVALLLPDAQPLPKDRYVVSQRGQFYGEEREDYEHLAVRHFVRTVRHLMYAEGMPLLWRRWRRKPV